MKSGRPTVTKRNREQARRERTQEKAARREQRAAEKRNRVLDPSGEDPDIAGIVPGPQPPIED
jgi:hypothetical protein